MKLPAILSALLLAACTGAFAADPHFTAIALDEHIQIGYGLAIADVDGDGHPDVILADKRQFVWYRNPGPAQARDPAAWHKYVLAENLTPEDNVCIAAQDIDGDGKCEIAVGAGWNPSDTEHSGAIFYLIPPADRTQPWAPVRFPEVEPTTHRMRWLRLSDGTWGLVVVPLHGRGNKKGEGTPVNVLLYHPPTPLNDPKGEWRSEVVDHSLHMTHNFDFLQNDRTEGVFIGGHEGMHRLRREKGGAWENLAVNALSNDHVGREGIGEIRQSVGTKASKGGYLATIEPMHGNRLMVYPAGDKIDAPPYDQGTLLTDRLVEGHALRVGDLLGVGADQIVVGWRGKTTEPYGTVGVAIWVASDSASGSWRETVIDPDGMACEDLQLADLDGDGKLDIIASGRRTHNVKVYFTDRATSAP